MRSKTRIEEHKKERFRIVVTDIPYQQTRDPIIKKIADLANEGKIPGISGVRDESDLKEPVRIVIDLKRDADPEVVLNQLYKFSPLQDTISIILLALVDGKPRTLSLKEMLQEFVRHRVTVIRRRTQFLLARARKRKHTVEGLLLAHANIDEVIRVIRASKTQAEAKESLMQIKTPAALMQRALGDAGFAQYQQDRGVERSPLRFFFFLYWFGCASCSLTNCCRVASPRGASSSSNLGSRNIPPLKYPSGGRECFASCAGAASMSVTATGGSRSGSP